MDKRRVESLRDLAIAHFPKAREKRAQAIKFHGGTFADIGLQSAYAFGNPEATAVEKQAIELLQLTFMHPNAPPMDPHVWDTLEDAETIAIKASTLAMGVEMQPQLEAAMLDAARLLCELTGDKLPPWVDAPVPHTSNPADAPAGEDNHAAAGAEQKAGEPPMRGYASNLATAYKPWIKYQASQLVQKNDTRKILAERIVELANKRQYFNQSGENFKANSIVRLLTDLSPRITGTRAKNGRKNTKK